MSDFQLSAITAGSAAVSTVRLLRSATLTGTPALDETQASNPVSYSGLSFVSGWATLPWVRGAYWYWIEAVDAEGRTSRSLPIWGGDQGDVEVTVGGKVDKDRWGSGQYKVRASLPALTVEGQQAYLISKYEATVAPDGSWSITGLPIGATATFHFPDGSDPERVLPETPGTVDFAALSEPA